MKTTLKSIPKTETYLGRKKYNEKYPNEKDHINLTKLIDSLIKVAIHMRDKLKEEPYLDFIDYVAHHGINYFASDKRKDRNNAIAEVGGYAKGVLQSEGVWQGRKLYPFFAWEDENKHSYNLRQGNVLNAIFDSLSKKETDNSKIVSIVEDVDMWFNS